MNYRDIITDSTPKNLRVFAALQFPFFCIIAWLFLKNLHPAMLGTLLGVSATLAVVGTANPLWVRPIYLVWMTLVFPIGFIVSHLAMGAVFYFVVTPIGFIRRRAVGDPMQRKFDEQAESYWQPLPKAPPAKSYFRQF